MFYKKIIQIKIIHTLLLLYVFSAALANATALTASVDRDTIGIKETLTLTLSVDEQTKSSPDFSGLKNDFDILSSQRSSSIQIINGSTESSTDWHLTLAPKHTGTLLIPSFNIANAVSDAIEIKVTQQNQTQISSNDDEQVKTATEVNKSSVYVQEQILVKIKLITEVNLSQAEMEPLEIKNAVVVNLDQQQYQTTINGKPHLIVETTFAIFPQESGEIVIPSLTYTVAIDNMRSIWNDPFGHNRNNILRLRTDEQHITVKPTPPQYRKDWQPANQLSLNETWSGSLDHLKIGEPITRTITINTDGLTAGQIAPIPVTNIDGLTFYPDQAQTKDNKTAKGVQGSRTEAIAIVPNRGGDFTLPAIDVRWWNNTTQQIETASLPAKTIHVLGGTTISTQSSSQANPITTTKESQTELSPTIHDNKEYSLPLWLLIITGLIIFLSIGLTIYVLRLRKHIQQLNQQQLNRETEQLEKEKDIWNALKTTAANKDAPAFRKAVLSWAHFQWPEQKITTLDDIAKLGMNEELTAALKQLDIILYSNHESSSWDVNNLLKLLNEFRKHKKTGKKVSELKKLYVE